MRDVGSAFVVDLSRIAARVSVIVVLALALPSDAHAECVKLWKTARDVQRNSTLVFSGTVIKTAESVEATFEVDRVWKGDVRRRTTLTLSPGIDSHGASYFKEGTAYLVFARVLPKLVRTDTAQDTPLFEISQCFPTRPLADAQEFVDQLGRGRPPRP
jgi:hypothetical protein